MALNLLSSDRRIVFIGRGSSVFSEVKNRLHGNNRSLSVWPHAANFEFAEWDYRAARVLFVVWKNQI